MKKVLFVNNGFPTTQKPNVATYALSIRDNIIKSGMNVETLVLDVNYSGKIGKVAKYIRFYLRLLICNFEQYDVIFFNHWPHVFLPTLFKKLNKNRVFIHWHGNDISAKSFVKRTLNRISYAFIRSHTKFIVPSSFFAKEVENLIPNCSKIFISPSGGVDLDVFNPVKRKLGEKIILGFASGISKRKGAETLLLALVSLKNTNPNIYQKIQVKLINFGHFDFEYYQLLLECKDVIQFVDKMAKSEMPTFYSSIDILLFPSQSESLGLVALEAMAMERPVIATDGFATPEYITDKITGFLIEKNSVPDLAETIGFAIENKHKIAEYGGQARTTIEKSYSSKYVIRQYRKLLNSEID